jgi:hypothetical protein
LDLVVLGSQSLAQRDFPFRGPGVEVGQTPVSICPGELDPTFEVGQTLVSICPGELDPMFEVLHGTPEFIEETRLGVDLLVAIDYQGVKILNNPRMYARLI